MMWVLLWMLCLQGTSFSYDSNGNRIFKTENGIQTETLFYDYHNRLVSLNDTTLGDYAYLYDHRTRRTGRNESLANGQSTQLSFSDSTYVQEIVANATTVEYVRGSDYGGGIGGVLYTIRSGARSYNAYNNRGDVVSQTGDNEAITWQAAYEAFGTRTEEEGTTVERQKANTKDEDPWGGLNEGMRYRDLETGVFLSRDPAGFIDGPNVYTYVNQNPWSAYDADGLFLGFIADAVFAISDTVQYARGNITGAQYAGRMALTGASVTANLTTAGIGGLAVRGATLAGRGAKIANATVKTAKAVDKANTAYETTKSVVENGEGVVNSALEGDVKGVLTSGLSLTAEAIGGKKADKTLGAATESQQKTRAKTQNIVEESAPSSVGVGPVKNLGGSIEDAASAARTEPYPRLFTKHANERMHGRGVSVERVEEAIKLGDRKIGNGVIVSNISATQSASGRAARVVTNPRGDVVTLIDKGSKKKK